MLENVSRTHLPLASCYGFHYTNCNIVKYLKFSQKEYRQEFPRLQFFKWTCIKNLLWISLASFLVVVFRVHDLNNVKHNLSIARSNFFKCICHSISLEPQYTLHKLYTCACVSFKFLVLLMWSFVMSQVFCRVKIFEFLPIHVISIEIV